MSSRDMEDSYSLCKNVKSKKDTKTRCVNTATHGNYCWLHYKRPNMWVPNGMITPATTTAPKIKARVIKANRRLEAATQIQQWFRSLKDMHQRRRRGPAYFARSLCVNDADFFSTDPVTDISGVMFFSYKDEKDHVYGFDVRSIAMLIDKSDDPESVENPFNRGLIPVPVIHKVHKLVRQLTRAKLPTKWEQLKPDTPVQQFRMKVVDLFLMIDQLNYYSSPNWFLTMNETAHKTFYRELHGIWNVRANLSSEQKRQIVPNYTQVLFRYPPWSVIPMSLEKLQSVNLSVIRTLITSAQDKNDRILGAMYVISALTLVSPEAREAYSWLYESVVADETTNYLMAEYELPPVRIWGLTNWLTDLFHLPAIPTHPPTPPPTLPPAQPSPLLLSAPLEPDIDDMPELN